MQLYYTRRYIIRRSGSEYSGVLQKVLYIAFEVSFHIKHFPEQIYTIYKNRIKRNQ
jgi:hypothetical protein